MHGRNAIVAERESGTMNARARLGALLCAAALLVPASAVRGAAQGRQRGGEPNGVSPAEVQRMFDAYALVQAQDALKLTDRQYPEFLKRFRELQEVRRRHQRERLRLLQELRVMTDPDAHSSETELKGRLKLLQDLDARTAADLRQAYDAIDQALDVRQQARFRVFEEQMERRKIELLIRARQATRKNPL
jgi:hypothetical protein